jgi:UDP-GlcNAc3NAcA epimerase
MKVVTVVGARPQFVKAGVVSSAFDRIGTVEELLVHTGQHFDDNMSDIFFRQLGLRAPAVNLCISGGSHAEMTGQMMIALERVFLKESPDVVLVYGDTNSTLAAALTASKIHLPIAHVEAGLRSFNLRMPEEINRILTDRVSRWLFAPTEAACRNLKREGFDQNAIFAVGDVMYDVAKLFSTKAEGSTILARSGLMGHRYALATVHRAENTDDPDRLSVIIDALSIFSKITPVLWPLHPRTRQVLTSTGLMSRVAETIVFCEPLGYLDMVAAEKGASLIITDSGGVQKEAYFHRVPCVTLRDQTEWVELVEAGWNRLVSLENPSRMAEIFTSSVGTVGDALNLYGDGNAAEKIVEQLVA